MIKSKKLFHYHDGSGEIKADPFPLLLRMLSLYPKESNLGHDEQLMRLRKPESVDAYLRLVTFARAVFSLEPYGEDDEGNHTGGVTDIEAMGVLGDFTAWLDETKKDTPSPPTSQPPTAPESSSSAASVVEKWLPSGPTTT